MPDTSAISPYVVRLSGGFVFIKDTTEASMEKQLQNQEQELESLLVLRDELSGLFVFDKEKTRGGTQHQQYLELMQS